MGKQTTAHSRYECPNPKSAYLQEKDIDPDELTHCLVIVDSQQLKTQSGAREEKEKGQE